MANPTITVSLAGTVTAASIFSTNAFVSLVNPFTGAVDGTYQFYAGNGRYDVAVVKSGFTFTAAETTDIVLTDPRGKITPTILAASTNDYAPTNANQAQVWYISASAAINLTGIAAPLFDGYTVNLVVIGSFTITVTNQDAASLAANRIITGTGASLALPPNASLTLVYDLANTTWRRVT